MSMPTHLSMSLEETENLISKKKLTSHDGTYFGRVEKRFGDDRYEVKIFGREMSLNVKLRKRRSRRGCPRIQMNNADGRGPLVIVDFSIEDFSKPVVRIVWVYTDRESKYLINYGIVKDYSKSTNICSYTISSVHPNKPERIKGKIDYGDIYAEMDRAFPPSDDEEEDGEEEEEEEEEK